MLGDGEYVVVVIKPLSIGRGQGPHILQAILDNSDLDLAKFRPWNVCSTTWKALHDISADTESAFELDAELVASHGRHAWVCLLINREDVPPRSPWLRDYIGPNNPREWNKNHLRYQFSARSHASDNVVYISPPGKEDLVAKLLFQNFDEDQL